MPIKWEDRYSQLGHLPENILYDLVRNQSAPTEFRTVAAEIMVMKGFQKANDPIVQHFLPTTPPPVVHESESQMPHPSPAMLASHKSPLVVHEDERSEVENNRPQNENNLPASFVKIGDGSPVEHSNLKEYVGPLKASVTTTSLYQPEIVAEPVQKMDTNQSK